jgi:mannitol-1-phosphate/altronate dehydrogenase
VRKKTFMGFGLGAVQSGLMLYEAFRSNNFDKFIISEIDYEIVSSVKNANSQITINISTKNGVKKSVISNVEICNSSNISDYNFIASSIYEADEMATAIPSTEFYDTGKSSIARLLAENINPNKYQILYTAENNNYAAEILLEKINKYAAVDKLKKFQILNTVIGKMGGVINDESTVKKFDLDWMTPLSKVAILVEEFNDIIISKIKLPGFERGIKIFREKDDLLPFEEVKLFGHNAVHSMLGFLASLKGYTYMSEIKNDPQLYGYGTQAFDNESGVFLLKKYKHFKDPLFTKEGFRYYGLDLLERITNPFLRDEVKRICRDPIRKLQYNDRFFGAIREALKYNVHPKILAKGVLGGICYIINNKIDMDSVEGINFQYPESVEDLDERVIRSILSNIWKEEPNDGLEEECMSLICSELDEFLEEYKTNKKIKSG